MDGNLRQGKNKTNIFYTYRSENLKNFLIIKVNHFITIVNKELAKNRGRVESLNWRWGLKQNGPIVQW